MAASSSGQAGHPSDQQVDPPEHVIPEEREPPEQDIPELPEVNFSQFHHFVMNTMFFLLRGGGDHHLYSTKEFIHELICVRNAMRSEHKCIHYIGQGRCRLEDALQRATA